jgi:two-component system cell cycle response regulator DivK
MAAALIIDDNTLNLETLRVLLQKEGMDAVTVSSPFNLAQQVANMPHVEVVFLDLEFPTHSGLKLVHDLRALPQLEAVPIIAYTVHISEQREVRDAGFDGFIGKPLNTQRFPDQLRRILAGETVWELGQ